MPKYSFPRNVWRALYPILIYIGMSLLVGIIAAAGYAAAAIIRSGMTMDTEAAVSTVQEFIEQYVLWIQMGVSAICIIFFIPMWVKTKKTMPKQNGAKMGPISLLLTVLGCLCMNLILACVIDITKVDLLFPSYEQISNTLVSGSLLVQILAVGLFAPIVEELICRGVVLNRLNFWMPAWLAVFFSSVLFGVMHLNMFQGLYAFLIGVVFAMLYLRFRNLAAAIVGHMAFNLANIALREIFELLGIMEPNSFVILVPSAILSIFAFVMLIKITKTPKAQIKAPAEESKQEPGPVSIAIEDSKS